MDISPFVLAQRYIGIAEMKGNKDHPLIQWWLSLCGFDTETHDEVAWCSAFVNGIAWELRLPRSKSAAARSWLGVGVLVDSINSAIVGDVVIMRRGEGTQPGPEVLNAVGHVGFFAGLSIEGNITKVHILGGNQGNSVSIQSFPAVQILGIRRLVQPSA